MAVYAIGDLQGCLEPLQRLLAKLKFKADKDQIWFCGDLINRGPESLATLRFVRGLCEQGNAVTVLGNHDLHLLAVAHGVRKPGRRDTIAEILAADDCATLLDWLRQQPLLHHDSAIGWTMMHAGLPPQWSIDEAIKQAGKVQKQLRRDSYPYLLSNMYGNEPAIWDDKLRNISRWRFTINCLTRMRYITPEGKLNFSEKMSPGHQAPGLIPWFTAEAPAWQGANIVCGHWSTIGAAQNGSVWSLDSGCVWGEQLTAIRLDHKNAEKRRFIQVEANA